jgi:hypothetical protein
MTVLASIQENGDDEVTAKLILYKFYLTLVIMN